jgi:hypothetical protein
VSTSYRPTPAIACRLLPLPPGFPEPNAGTAAVFVDKFDAGLFESGADLFNRLLFNAETGGFDSTIV